MKLIYKSKAEIVAELQKIRREKSNLQKSTLREKTKSRLSRKLDRLIVQENRINLILQLEENGVKDVLKRIFLVLDARLNTDYTLSNLWFELMNLLRGKLKQVKNLDLNFLLASQFPTDLLRFFPENQFPRSAISIFEAAILALDVNLVSYFVEIIQTLREKHKKNEIRIEKFFKEKLGKFHQLLILGGICSHKCDTELEKLYKFLLEMIKPISYPEVDLIQNVILASCLKSSRIFQILWKKLSDVSKLKVNEECFVNSFLQGSMGNLRLISQNPGFNQIIKQNIDQEKNSLSLTYNLLLNYVENKISFKDFKGRFRFLRKKGLFKVKLRTDLGRNIYHLIAIEKSIYPLMPFLVSELGYEGINVRDKLNKIPRAYIKDDNNAKYIFDFYAVPREPFI
eukprot:snap_masked-scaffold_2-processed-gene-22.17-mRNA-1 protein AED:1.00 eAED:1.00 QI:0/0/0/0/1/1/2/0/397